MIWRLETSRNFDKEFKKLDGYTQRVIQSWIAKNIKNTSDPRSHGKALAGNLAGLWRYRIGDYRLIAQIRDEKFVILAISVGHRSKIY